MPGFFVPVGVDLMTPNANFVKTERVVGEREGLTFVKKAFSPIIGSPLIFCEHLR